MKKLISIISSSRIVKYIIAFGITVVLAVGFLASAAFLPQETIQNHVLESIDTAYRDIENNFIFDSSLASQLDVGTDLLILRTSLSTNRRYMGSILTNPIYTYEGLTEWADVPETLARLAYEFPSDNVWFYSRYWMGFRVLMRLALVFFNYGQIKRYLAFVFFSLYTAAICSVSKNTNSKLAFLFAMSIVMVRPYVMATSMQYTCCFLIAFLAMLMIPWLCRHNKWEGLFFMELGMITMYFDFYTVPMVAMGFPLLYLCILNRGESVASTIKKIFKNMAFWFIGYGFMWIAKLVLTSLLTAENALEIGLQSFFGRVGIQKDPELGEYYSIEAAFKGVREAIFSDEIGKVIYLLGAAIVLAVVLYKLMRGKTSGKNLRDSLPYLLIAVLPLIWFVITKQPTAIHDFFQYRNIALTHWAAGVFLHCLLVKKEEQACIT